MKSKTLRNISHVRRLFYYFDEIKRWLFLGLFLPLTICFFLMEWDYRVLIFILMGYAAALIGFLFAKTPVGKVLLSAEEDLFHRLIARSTTDILMVHCLESGRNVFITDSVKTVLGFQPHHVVNRYCTFLIHPEDRKKMMQLLNRKSIQAQTSLSTRLRVMEKGGSYRWMSFTVKGLDEVFGQKKYVVCSFKDVQKQQEMENVSRMYVAELMRKDPAIVLENEVSDQMLGLMTAHELKEPLRTIQGYIQLLELRHKKQLDDEGKECLHFVGESVQRLNGIVDDIESLFKVDTHQTILKRVDTKKLVDGTLKLLGSKIRNKNASVIVGMLPEIMADAGQLKHVFQNLIDNALTFNEGQPNIKISCKQQSNYWVFEVRDNGFGVPEKYKEEIFDAFRRLHGPRDFGAGSGMGLPICKKVIGNHGGSIWVNNYRNGEGSRFFFSLPMQPKAEPVSSHVSRN